MAGVGSSVSPPPAAEPPRLHLNTPDLNLSRMSHLTIGTGISSHSGKSSGEASGKSSGTDDEDEDIPLGILAAQGFPRKGKQPVGQLRTSPSNNSSRPSLPLSAPPASVSGGEFGRSRGNLPVFARNLPQDPYAMKSPRQQGSVGGVQTFGGVAPGQVHPSGLVGVIAGEERARAMRRTSPGEQGGHPNAMPQHPGMMGRSQTMNDMSQAGGYPGMGGGMPGMMPGMLTPGDQMQIQMAHQMNEMMQMQMQWMQQMQNMQNMMANGQMPQFPPPPMPTMDMLNDGSGHQRPFSMPLLDPPRQNRAMSLTPDSMGQWNRKSAFEMMPSGGLQGGYAASLAPSERSNVGMASRYRPVSIMGDPVRPPVNRASTFTAGTLPQWNENPQPAAPSLSPTPTPTQIPRRPVPSQHLEKTHPSVEDDDDEGWADMKKKRDKKRSLWRIRKRDKGGA